MKTLYDKKDLWWQDKFELCEDHGYWLYYNADGNDGDGQIVEVCIYPCDVLIDADTEDEFWDHLSSVCTTYLYDRCDEDFNSYVMALLEKEENSATRHNYVTQDTMKWIINWAKKYV